MSDLIEQWAREAGLMFANSEPVRCAACERFAALVAAHERERALNVRAKGPAAPADGPG